MSTSVVADTSALTGRSLKHILRSPDTIITTAVMPIAIMLLFVYVFGGAISAPGGDYKDWLLPGIMAQTIAAGWPENIAVSRFCCRLLSHDEATIGAFIDAAAAGDRRAFEMALDGLIRPERAHRLWESALALAAAEMRSF